ncbi:MFS transporter [Gracilibacillus alcaliphilus]|uniref:MFS transporter n=1 Tax=Gracilibacillus alcaliphilus TaxID=1401441 RepID=UPI00195BC74B|nr:ACDE family multidrug resistance protein [Gracilibacillus alcaliphilus]
MKGKKLDIIALASIPLVMTLGNSMLIPVLPMIEQELQISSFQSSLLITVYSVVAILLIPLAGYLSDKIGRKKVMVPSLLITGIGGLVSAIAAWKMADPFFVILIGRFLQGIGAAGAFPIVIPTVGDMFDDEKDVSAGLGMIETSNTFGKVLSPIIGALLAIYIWFLPFLFIPIFSAVAVGLIWFLLEAPKRPEDKQGQTFADFLRMIRQVFRDNGRWLIGIFLIGAINMFILFAFLFHFSTLLEKQYQLDGVMKGLVLAIPLLFLCIASYITGKKIGQNKLVMKWTIFIANLIGAVPLLWIKGDLGLVFLSILLSLSGLGIGISLPALDALITEGVEKDIRGTVTALYSSMRFLGVAAGPLIMAVLMERSDQGTYYILAGLGAVAAILTLITVRPTKEESVSS